MIPYYERGGITIYCGDCLEVMPKLDVTFDAILADLPYGTTACSWDTIIPFEPLWENYKRLVKGNGAVVLFGSQPFTSKLIMSNLEWFKYEWIWDKVNPSGFLNAKFMPLKSHENIVIFGGSKTTYNPQLVPRPKGAQRKGSVRATNEIAYDKGVYGKYLKRNNGFKGEWSNPISLIQINTGGPWVKKKQDHPTQKPVALLQYLIRTYTNSGDIILDNTMGSGTTLLAAQNEGRRGVGIELSEEYCKVAVERLKQPSFFSIPDKPKITFAKQTEMVL